MAKNNVVSILTSHFKEKLRFLLPFQSVIGDSDVNQIIKGITLILELSSFSLCSKILQNLFSLCNGTC